MKAIRLFVVVVALMLIPAQVYAQIRYAKLVVPKATKITIDKISDILVADTLILQDSAIIELNPLRTENIIRSRFIHVEGSAYILGNGANGQNGRNGRPGTSGQGPCKDGTNGYQAQNGLAGVNGVNLVMYSENLIIGKQLVISLEGGHGGHGGGGGAGGDGSPGTVHCSGGNGGNGGNGGKGGDGGWGGNFTFQGPDAFSLKELLGTKLIVHNRGGLPGRGGQGGVPGAAGLGPNNKNGRNGLPGTEGIMGAQGKPGTITFRNN